MGERRDIANVAIIIAAILLDGTLGGTPAEFFLLQTGRFINRVRGLSALGRFPHIIQPPIIFL